MSKFLKKILAIIFAIVYTASPIDCIADVIPITGQADDIIVIIAAILYIIKVAKKKEKKE